MATALFVCRQNAGRSQMSAALFERAAEGRHRALSAGTAPAERVHPEVVAVMRELGVDLSDRVPQALTRDLAEQADVVVTMGCGDECPYIPGKRYVDWELEDPAGRPADEVRVTRDDIARRVEELVAQLEDGEEGFDSTGRPAAEPDPSSHSPEIPPNDGSPRGPRPPKRRDGGHGRAAHPG